MKNILLNKKWLNIIALLLLVISLSSCSATGYWWGEYESPYGGMVDCSSPLKAAREAFFSPMNQLFNIQEEESNFALNLIGWFWFLALPSALLYFFGRGDDITGVKYYDIGIDGKKHRVEDWSEAYSVSGTGSSERGHKWAEVTICLIFSASIYYILYSWITGWFDDLNMLLKVIIGGGIIIVLYKLRGILLPLSSLAKYISWVFCSIDFILGVLVTLWIN